MSPTKTILRTLARAYEDVPDGGFTRPTEIPGFSQEPERFQKAVNELLKDRLIEGRRGDDGHMTVALNAHKMAEVQRRLRPVWAHPAVWAAAVVVGALGVGLAM